MRFAHDLDTEERVEPVDFGLVWDGGAPNPHLIQSESRTFLAFYLLDPDPTSDGTLVNVVDPGATEEHALGVIEWLRCGGAVLGGLNDEAFHGHPLWKRGLEDSSPRGYAAAEVFGSRWIGEWEEANRTHDRHSPQLFGRYRHFILEFHDSTFECVAEGFIAYRARRSMPSLLAKLARHVVDDRPLDFEPVARSAQT